MPDKIPDSTKAETAGDLEKRIRAVETDVATARGGVKVIGWLWAGAVALLGYGLFWLGSLGSDVKNIDKRLDRLEKTMDDLNRKQIVPTNIPVRDGIVERVDADQVAVRIGPGKEDVTSYVFTPNGYILVHGKYGKITDLKRGDKVYVFVHSESDHKGVAFGIETTDLPPPGVIRYQQSP